MKTRHLYPPLLMVSLLGLVGGALACDDDPVDPSDSGIAPDATTDIAPIDAHDSDPTTPSDASDTTTDVPPDPPQYDLASGPLEIGYARVEAPWRVGAKPGQVGTAARSGIEQEMASLLSDIFSVLLNETDPTVILEESTAWTLGLLEDETDNTEAGDYANWFEPSIGIEQPPDIKTLVIQRGELKVAVVRADIYLMHEFLHRHVANLVQEDTGLGRDQIFLAGTHNHSAPQPSSPAPGVWSLADGFDPRHFVYLSEKIAASIRQANDARRPARMRAQRTEYRDLQFNIIGPTTTAFAPDEEADQQTVQVGYPHDYFDADLDLIYFDDAAPPHEPIALLFSLGMHPETLPSGHGLISGEFPIHTEKHLHRRTQIPAMWLPGALGDIEPDQGKNNDAHDFWRHSFEGLHEMSHRLADGVSQALDQLLDDPSIVADKTPHFRNISRDIPGTSDFPLPTTAYLQGIRIPSPRVLHGSSRIRLQAIRLGDTLLLGLPAEVTSDLSYNIKSRVNDEDGDVYQGYLYPDNPDWVAERVEANFSTTQVEPSDGAPIPIVTSMVNGYIGYVVTRWEYENREHYRMQLTPYGPESADHLAHHTVALVDEMMGGEYRQFEIPDWVDVDAAGVEALMDFLGSLEPIVADLQRQLPAADSGEPGEIIAAPHPIEPADIDPAHGSQPALGLQWRGGTADLEPPTATLEHQIDDQWEPLSVAPSLSAHLFFEPPNRWYARWHPQYMAGDIEADAPLRIRVQGAYRGTETTGDIDPIWDPEGRNESYEFTTTSFSLNSIDGED